MLMKSKDYSLRATAVLVCHVRYVLVGHDHCSGQAC